MLRNPLKPLLRESVTISRVQNRPLDLSQQPQDTGTAQAGEVDSGTGVYEPYWRWGVSEWGSGEGWGA